MRQTRRIGCLLSHILEFKSLFRQHFQRNPCLPLSWGQICISFWSRSDLVLGADHRFNFFEPNTGNSTKAANSRIWGLFALKVLQMPRLGGLLALKVLQIPEFGGIIALKCCKIPDFQFLKSLNLKVCFGNTFSAILVFPWVGAKMCHLVLISFWALTTGSIFSNQTLEISKGCKF